jgi:hypothetical protein
MKERLVLEIQCNAPARIFEGDFSDLLVEQQELFDKGLVKCESGTLGTWCLDCQFGDVERELEFEF